jgi:hypothetical protein
MASNSEWGDEQAFERRPTDPVVFVVHEAEPNYRLGVPYDRVVQVVRRRLGLGRAETVEEIRARVEDGELRQVMGDRLRLPRSRSPAEGSRGE